MEEIEKKIYELFEKWDVAQIDSDTLIDEIGKLKTEKPIMR